MRAPGGVWPGGVWPGGVLPERHAPLTAFSLHQRAARLRANGN